MSRGRRRTTTTSVLVATAVATAATVGRLALVHRGARIVDVG